MLIQEYLSIINSAPKIVQQTITSLAEMEKAVDEEKKLLTAEMLSISSALDQELAEGPSVSKEATDKQLQRINQCYIKILDIDKKKIMLLTALESKLDAMADMIKETSNEFKETIGRGALFHQINRITEVLDQQQISNESSEEENYSCCTCNKLAGGEMIACDNPGCPIEWYHADCIGLKAPPKKKWVCPICTKEKEKEQ